MSLTDNVTHDLDETIRSRRSVRGFLPDRPVPLDVLQETFALAQTSPSNCNVQPWRVYFASGPRCQRLRESLTGAFDGGTIPDPEDAIDEFPPPYRRLQVNCAMALYDQMGVERHDKMGRMMALRRNFELFDAPQVAMICMEKSFGVGVALDVGMYVQTLTLALWARGVASCAQASLRLYPHVVRKELEIPDNLRIICGLALGYEDPSVPANRCRQERAAWTENVFIREE